MAVRLASVGGRAQLLVRDRSIDVERRSAGRFPVDPMDALARWDEFREWADGQAPADADPELDPGRLDPCVPRPRKVFGIALNYVDHAAEAGLEIPEEPLVFTKFPSCLVGARAQVALTSNRVDWEVELVAVIGRGGSRIPEGRAFDHLAGYCVGQDISDRRIQFRGKPPQFSLGKSADTFGPIGPAVVSLDAVPDPDDLRLTCDVAGERMQDGRTRDMIFSVSELVAYLSGLCTLEPGDLIFTGTPAGVGSVRRRYLAEGELVRSEIEPLGVLENRCAGPRSPYSM